MANTKSAIKRIKQNDKRRLRNRTVRGTVRGHLKRARTAIANEELELAKAEALLTISALDKAQEKGVLHKNNVARSKSRLMKRLNSLEAKVTN